MTQFECSVKDLNGKQEEITEEIDAESPKSILSRGKQKGNVNQNVNLDVNNSLFAKISEEKNVRIILLVIIAYLITNSSQFTELLGNSFPYLVESGVTNLSGKVVIAILIGLSVVLFTSFFQVP
jgi:replication fork clamp-binding protein CrfC